MLQVLKRTVSMRRSFEHQKHVLILMGKKIFTIYPQIFCLSKPMLLKMKLTLSFVPEALEAHIPQKVGIKNKCVSGNGSENVRYFFWKKHNFMHFERHFKNIICILKGILPFKGKMPFKMHKIIFLQKT